MNDNEIKLKLHEQLFIGELENFLDGIHRSVLETRNQANDTLDKISRLKAWITTQEIKKAELKVKP